MLVLFCLLVRLVHLPYRPCMRIRRLNQPFGSLRRGEKGVGRGERRKGGAYPAYSSIFRNFTRYGRVFPHSGVLTGHACRFTLERDYLSVLLNHRRTSLLFSSLGSSPPPSLCIWSGLFEPPNVVVPHVPRRRHLKVDGLVAIDSAIGRAGPARPSREAKNARPAEVQCSSAGFP
ncbi:hypothetical protein CCUS01_01259 [Colletotrichum cuscutae]|uniref:Secreted protein n=1 Tax=Colletotrichum cuscutae TaxID=1209917 RepID=A0AAI9V0G0_9PEZI|nr:hypothetical protein CCUS01_01259 [Colletotrichum cuscutae]